MSMQQINTGIKGAKQSRNGNSQDLLWDSNIKIDINIKKYSPVIKEG